jgi:hypothetical protein
MDDSLEKDDRANNGWMDAKVGWMTLTMMMKEGSHPHLSISSFSNTQRNIFKPRFHSGM